MNQKQQELEDEGIFPVVGIDEAGRGPLAGPVVAAAVILDPEVRLSGLDDSKKLSAKKREKLYNIISEEAVAFATGIVDNKMIDQINIQQASFLAMKKAVTALNKTPGYLLVDGNFKIPRVKIQQETVVNGDGLVNCIAAASIMAKVTRDRIIDRYHEKYPQYGFINNKGYGTEEHINALEKYGVCPLHRLSYSIVKKNRKSSTG